MGVGTGLVWGLCRGIGTRPPGAAVGLVPSESRWELGPRRQLLPVVGSPLRNRLAKPRRGVGHVGATVRLSVDAPVLCPTWPCPLQARRSPERLMCPSHTSGELQETGCLSMNPIVPYSPCIVRGATGCQWLPPPLQAPDSTDNKTSQETHHAFTIPMAAAESRREAPSNRNTSTQLPPVASRIHPMTTAWEPA